MPVPREISTVLFLGTANHDRSRAAEVLFNAVAERMGLPFRSSSRGVGVGTAKVKGAMAADTVRKLQAMGHRSASFDRPPEAVTADDLTSASRVVVIEPGSLGAFLQSQPSGLHEKTEHWQVAAGDVAAVEREVIGLVTRMIGGRMDAPPTPPPPPPPKKALTAKVGRETAGRKGKGVTTVFDASVSESELVDLCKRLKERIGTGGTVKDGRIEIQGDNRDRVVAELEKLGFKVKRAGG